MRSSEALHSADADHNAVRNLFERAASAFRFVLTGVGDAHLDRPTPCEPLSVAELVPRAIGHQTWVRRRMQGRTEAATYPPIERRRWVNTFDDSTTGLLIVLDDQAALDRPVELAEGLVFSGGDVGVLAARNIFQFAWDLAVATDQDPDLSPDVAAELLEISRNRLVPQRGPNGFFGPEHVPPAGAPTATVLAGYLGRAV